MGDAEQRFEDLRRKFRAALAHEWPQLARLRRDLGTAQAIPIGPPLPGAAAAAEAAMPTLATVATDGGENRLVFDPVRIQILRVADNRGTVYFEELVPHSLPPDRILATFFQGDPRLTRFLKFLGITTADLLPGDSYQRGNLLAMLRELLEWAALLKLASQDGPMLLLRDGLLRSVLLPQKVFDAIRARLRQATADKGHLLAGVAKRSAVINYLSLAFSLDRVFPDDAPAYLPIPREMEQEAAPRQYRWLGARSMGDLYVARLDRGPGVTLFPVDVAEWQKHQVGTVMRLLHRSARGSFPLRGYPDELMVAHEHARLAQLDADVLQSLLLDEIAALDQPAQLGVRELLLLGRELLTEEEER